MKTVFQFADGSAPTKHELDCVAQGLGFSSVEHLHNVLTHNAPPALGWGVFGAPRHAAARKTAPIEPSSTAEFEARLAQEAADRRARAVRSSRAGSGRA